MTEDDLYATNDLLRKNIVYYFQSNLLLMPKNNPKSFYIQLKVGKENPVELVQRLIDIIQVPFRIFLDFFAITKSSTRPDVSLLHPSVSTSFNETNLIRSFKDEENLLSELHDENLAAKILEKHHTTRR